MSAGAHSLSGWWQARWTAWWDARLTRKDQLTLTQRNLYILPTRAGWSLGAVFIVLLLASINEQLNLGYALSFTLGGAALAAMHHTHGNLQGVTLRLLGLHSVHAGEVVCVGVALSHGARSPARCGLKLHAGERMTQGSAQGPGSPVDAELAPGGETQLTLDVATHARGWLALPRITIETRYPLGIFRAWAHWRPLSQVLVWPALDAHAPALPAHVPDGVPADSRHTAAQAGEMPEGLRDYRRGDPMRLIAWKKSSHGLASGTGLVSREPATGRAADLLLDFDLSAGLHGLGTEAKLSRLATWLYQAEAQAQAHGPLYGLRLPGQSVACAAGSQHLRHCLDALALWRPTA